MLSDAETREIEHELTLVPYKSGACIEALKIVQRHRGWVPDDAVADVARLLDMSADEVDSVASFYNLIFRRPVGRHVVLVCDSVSCWILDNRSVILALRERLGVDFGGTSADGRFTLLPIQCLGTCDHAPALMVDEDLHQDVTAENVGTILDRYGKDHDAPRRP